MTNFKSTHLHLESSKDNFIFGDLEVTFSPCWVSVSLIIIIRKHSYYLSFLFFEFWVIKGLCLMEMRQGQSSNVETCFPPVFLLSCKLHSGINFDLRDIAGSD